MLGKISKIALCGLMTGLTAGGCGTESGSPDGSPGADGAAANFVTPENFFPEVVKATCQQLFRCCKPDELSAMDLQTESDCVRLLSSAGAIVGDLEQAVKDKRVVYDGKKAAACLEDLAKEACGTNTDASNPMAGHPSCEAALGGQIAPGGVCQSGWDCGSGARCVSPGTVGDPGTCVAPGKAGDDCHLSFDCGDNLRCDDTSQCAPKKAGGADCAFGDDCATGTCTNGKCALAPACNGR